MCNKGGVLTSKGLRQGTRMVLTPTGQEKVFSQGMAHEGCPGHGGKGMSYVLYNVVQQAQQQQAKQQQAKQDAGSDVWLGLMPCLLPTSCPAACVSLLCNCQNTRSAPGNTSG